MTKGTSGYVNAVSEEKQRFPTRLEAMQRLVDVVQELSQARDVTTITRITRDAARELTGADGATFVLRDGEQCYYADENAIEPLWKGKRFPMEMCVSGWVMLNRTPAVIEDIYNDPRVPAEAYRPTFVKSLAMVPIRTDAPVGAIGNYWADNYTPTEDQLAVLQALANTTSVALENVRLIEELRQKVETLEVQAVRIKQQHESLEVFTHALAHDLKEPVRTVRAFSDLIAEGDADDSQPLYFDFIRKAADRMGMLVETVYTYTRLHDPSRAVKTTTDAGDALAGAQDNLRQLITSSGAVIKADALPLVDANAAQLLQVFQNLIANAIKHATGPARIRVAADDDGSQWHFTVADNGPGIAEGDLQRIFLPFKRLRLNEDGAGLGLAICAKIVAMHGGRIWCESAEGKGATFHFTLPKAEGETRRAETPTAGDAAPVGGAGALARVLLVDDREADLELTRILLRDRDKAEFDLNVARSGTEALDMLRKARVGGERYDLILLDINMPGMDGFETLEVLRREGDFADMTVVMCTGSTLDSDQEQARKLGVAGYMVKPASLAQLRPMLDAVPALRWQDNGPAARLLRVA
jgi:signal transduction histidine kinase/ActR/RegA family two-component response regulator